MFSKMNLTVLREVLLINSGLIEKRCSYSVNLTQGPSKVKEKKKNNKKRKRDINRKTSPTPLMY